MATLQNPSSFHFSESHPQAYSHGLELIYKLENVDLATVRKFSSAHEVPKETAPPSNEEKSAQLEFDFGPLYRGWMVPYVFKEPIQVLQLVKQIERNLLEKGCSTLEDLKRVDLKGMGLGQGHIEDVKRKLENYIGKKGCLKAYSIDFESFIKCIVADLDPKRTFILLSAFGVADWMCLSQSDRADLKKVAPEVKRKWELELLDEIKGQKKATFEENWNILIETWILPWMYARGGLASQDDIEEALLLRSADPDFAKKALGLLSVCFDNRDDSLFRVHGGFAASNGHLTDHLKIETAAHSYFCCFNTYYALETLALLVTQELAKNWHAVTLEKVKLSLKFSPLFDCYRNKRGEWIIKKVSYAKA